MFGYLDGVGAGAGSGFAYCGPEACSDYALGDLEFAGHEGYGTAFAGGSKGVGLVLVEWSFGVLEGLGGQVGVDYAEAKVHAAYCVCELRGRAVLQREAFRSGV